MGGQRGGGHRLNPRGRTDVVRVTMGQDNEHYLDAIFFHDAQDLVRFGAGVDNHRLFRRLRGNDVTVTGVCPDLQFPDNHAISPVPQGLIQYSGLSLPVSTGYGTLKEAQTPNNFFLEYPVAELHPFRGTHYDPLQAGDPARLICPPYDVISAQLQQGLYDRNNHNFIRIEFGHELPQDKETDNRYTRAAATMKRWLDEGVLVTDRKPAFYVDDHTFVSNGRKYVRRSLTGVIKLEEWESGVVKPHEGTGARDKSDRLSLLYALQANTSPIMGLYEDTSGQIAKTMDYYTLVDPVITAEMGDGESHHLWAITDTTALQKISYYLGGQPIYIADGHHRYESALNYRRERRLRVNTEPGTEPFDYAMMTLIEFNDPGLVILPTHRLVRGLSVDSLEALRNGLEMFFEVTTVPVAADNVTDQIISLLAVEEGTVRMVLFGLEHEVFHVITVRDFMKIKPMMPYFHTELYGHLDVSIVDHVLLEELLGLTHDLAPAHVAYTTDATELLKSVREEEFQLGIFVNPVKATDIRGIADAGDRMPRKSTYFFPKIPAGLVTYRYPRPAA